MTAARGAVAWIHRSTCGHVVANATEHDVALRNAADTLIGLASAAGGALVGVLAPSPTHSKQPVAGSG